MSKHYVITRGIDGTSTVSCESEAIAVKLCVFAIATGCWFAFYAK